MASRHPKLYGPQRCYYCTIDEHHECNSVYCLCCGERNRKHNEQVAAAVEVLKDILQEKINGEASSPR